MGQNFENLGKAVRNIDVYQGSGTQLRLHIFRKIIGF